MSGTPATVTTATPFSGSMRAEKVSESLTVKLAVRYGDQVRTVALQVEAELLDGVE